MLMHNSQSRAACGHSARPKPVAGAGAGVEPRDENTQYARRSLHGTRVATGATPDGYLVCRRTQSFVNELIWAGFICYYYYELK